MHRRVYVLGVLGQAKKGFSKIHVSRVGCKLPKSLPQCRTFVSEPVGADG